MRTYGYFRPIVKEVVERYLDCGNARSGFALMNRSRFMRTAKRCRRCRGTMKVIAFLTDYAVVDRIIGHLKLTFTAERPPPPEIAFQEFLMAADPTVDCFL